MAIKNTFGVSRIVYRQHCRCFCPLGKAWYTNNFTILIEPGMALPDYCEIDEWITHNLEGEHLLIEAAAQKLMEWLTDCLNCKVTVTSTVTDATHGNVCVTVRGGDAR